MLRNTLKLEWLLLASYLLKKEGELAVFFINGWIRVCSCSISSDGLCEAWLYKEDVGSVWVS